MKELRSLADDGCTHRQMDETSLVKLGARPRYRQAVVALLQSLERDPNVEIVPLTEELYAQGFTCFKTDPTSNGESPTASRLSSYASAD